MAERLWLEYDPVGDILYIGLCRPYVGQDSEEIDEGIVARRHPDTDEVESLEILHYSKRDIPGLGEQISLTLDFRQLTEMLTYPKAA